MGRTTQKKLSSHYPPQRLIRKLNIYMYIQDPNHRRVIPPVNTFGAADDAESYLRAKSKMGLTRRTHLDDDDDDD